MAQSPDKLAVYLEIGEKRTFAGAVDWQGWCRNGRDAAYLGRLGRKIPEKNANNQSHALHQMRRAMLAGLETAAHGELAARGPRGGLCWTPRYFVRRVAWHVLDHMWEIQDRVERMWDEE